VSVRRATGPPLVSCLPQSRERQPGLDFSAALFLALGEGARCSVFALALPRSRSLPRTASSSVAVFSPARARAPFWASPAGCPRRVQARGPWLHFSVQRSLLGSASVERWANPFLAVFFRSGTGRAANFLRLALGVDWVAKLIFLFSSVNHGKSVCCTRFLFNRVWSLRRWSSLVVVAKTEFLCGI
jgi:hypothetical protein